MGDANGYDDVDGDAAVEARFDLVAEGVRAAGRVGDDEEPPLGVTGDCAPRSRKLARNSAEMPTPMAQDSGPSTAITGTGSVTKAEASPPAVST